MANTYLYVNPAVNSGSSGDGGNSNPNIITVEPSEGGAGITAALVALKALDGGIVQLLTGDYIASAPISPFDAGTPYICDTVIQGTGETRIIHDGSFDGTLLDLRFQTTGPTSISNTTQGNTSITVGTPGILTPLIDFLPIPIIIQGVDSDTLADAENNIIVSADDVTGVCNLQYPLSKTLTTPSAIFLTNGMRNIVRDVILVLDTPPATQALALVMQGGIDTLLSNVRFEGWDQAPNSANSALVDFQFCINTNAERCTIVGSKNIGFRLGNSVDCHLNLLRIEDSVQNGNSNESAIQFDNAFDCTAKYCQVNGSGFNGFNNRNEGRRNKWLHNSTLQTAHAGMQIRAGVEFIVDGNTVERVTTDDSGISVNNPSAVGRHQITNNIVKNCTVGNTVGIFLNGGSDSRIRGNHIEDIKSYHIFLQGAADRCVITDNYTHLNQGGDASIAVSGIDKCIISNNLVNDPSGRGIHVMGDSDQNVINGNIILAAATASIALENSADNNIVTNNNCFGLAISQGTGTGNIFANNIE